MRCDCCNRLLNDYEATIRHLETDDFVNTCITCLDGLGISWYGREDLNPFDRVDEYDDYDDYEYELSDEEE
jgi:hypothetical protein